MRRTCMILLALTVGAIVDGDTLQDQDARTISSYIDRQAMRERGEEYKDARKVLTGDLNKDGMPDAAVLYTIEGQGGSNNYVQYLAVFVRSKAGLEPVARAVVGGKLNRAVELVGVNDNAVELATMSYGPNDPACCPSVKGGTRYVLAGRTLKEEGNGHPDSRHH